MSALRVVPVTLRAARAHVQAHHSHLAAPVGGLFAVGVARDGVLCCVAIVGHPVARMLTGCAEVTRVASDGTRHAASMALGAAGRAGLALGWRRLVSYTLLGEPGTSYRAAGWWPVAVCDGGSGRARTGPARPRSRLAARSVGSTVPTPSRGTRRSTRWCARAPAPCRCGLAPRFSRC